MFNHDNRGNTLMETLIAVTVTMIVLTAAMRLLTFTSESVSRAVVRGELTECARTAADVMSVNIQRVSEFKLILNGNNTLKRLELIEPGMVFAYEPDAKDGSTMYHRLLFTGLNENVSNELASNLADIRILLDKPDILYIEILTDNTITTNADSANKRANTTVEPVFIRVPVNIAGKKILP